MRFVDAASSAMRQSLRLRLGLLLGAIALLALLAISLATVLLDSATGRGGAINVTGSLRMLGYRVALSAVDASPGAADRFELAVATLDARLSEPELREALASAATRLLLAEIQAAWTGEFEPASRRMRAATDAGLAPAIPGEYRGVVVDFVDRADMLTRQLEQALDSRLANLRMVQGLALLTVFGLVLAALYLIRTQVLRPLADLLEAARALRARRFDARVSREGVDELGQLGRAFNALAVALQASYASLEGRVAEKTAELALSHRQLELLYAITRTLSEKPPSEQTLREVLATVCASVGARAALVRAVTPAESGDGFVVATVDAGAGTDLLARLQAAQESAIAESGEFAVLVLPLREGGEGVGALAIALRPARELAAWERSLLQSVAQHVGAALANARRLQDEQRLGLYRERAVIARELHDSLAQSLSYMKIQVARMAAEQAAGRDAGRILTELRTGLNSAYRQLRELLTTFRLRIGDQGFGGSLMAAVDEFAARAGVGISLRNGIPDAALSAAEQIHVLQIVREALANVLHHAKARCAEVELSIDPGRAVRVRIDDDGVGMAVTPADAGLDRRGRQHHGLGIMRDRAGTLGGAIAFGARPGGGTRVELAFVAATPFATR
jgi:two-component system nitrate/nitrite sensor histidine kinase NarX